MSNACFATQLTNYKRSTAQLAVRLFLDLIFLISLPLVAILVPLLLPTLWEPPGELMIVGLLKISSIATLGVHAARSAPGQTLDTFQYNIGWMCLVVAIMAAYLMAKGLPCPPEKFICSWPHYQWTLLIISVLSFSYMFVFAFQNWLIIRRENQNFRLKLSIEAFIFGVNIPSILAFVSIIVVYAFALVERSDIFLSGAIALLVFASSAASICVDHYVRIFNQVGTAPCQEVPKPAS